MTTSSRFMDHPRAGGVPNTCGSWPRLPEWRGGYLMEFLQLLLDDLVVLEVPFGVLLEADHT